MATSGARQLFYAVTVLTGLVITWYSNLHHSGLAGYMADWFANDASSSVAVDLIVVAVVAVVAVASMFAESRRIGSGCPSRWRSWRPGS